MILFVFEGERREPIIFKTINSLYFKHKEQSIVCSFGNNIYKLYTEMKALNGDGDIVALMSEILKNSPSNPLTGYNKVSDFSEVFLFFDYDLHDDATNMTINEKNDALREMLSFFNDETGNGKLYVNYPMVESIRYTKEIPDTDYWQYVVKVSDCAQFKKIARDFSFYGNLDFISHKRDTEEDYKKAFHNWEILKEQNTSKANFICNDVLGLPTVKADIPQDRIFESQVSKFVLTKNEISILNSFPLFLFEYFK